MSLYYHATYLTLSILMTVWVARTLHSNGRIFLIDAFHGNLEMADSVNHLLVVGFYLVNLGFVILGVRYGSLPTDAVQFVELMSTKIGGVLLALGGMHFMNMYNFDSFRRRSIEKKAAPEAAPQLQR